MPASSPPFLDPAWASVLLLLGAAACWYIAANAAAAALPNRASAFVLAGGLPAMAGVAWFAITGRSDAALALALGAGVAAATLGMGLVVNADPSEGQRIAEDPGRRLKATLLPAAITLLVAGFAGSLSLLHAVLLLAVGGIIAWLGLSTTGRLPTAAVAHSAEGSETPAPEPASIPAWAATLQVLMAAVLAIAGAGLAACAAGAASRRQGIEIDATFATLLVSAIIALPLIGIGTRFASAGQGLVAQRGMALVAVFMICLAVPAAVLIGVFHAAEEAREAGVGWRALALDPPTVFMPLRLWRTDAVVLCVAALLLLPPAAGRYRLGKFEGAGLIVLYVIYLLITLSPWR